MGKIRKRGVRITLEGQDIVEQAIAHIAIDECNRLTNEEIGSRAGNLDAGTVRRFRSGETNVDKSSARRILEALGISDREEDILAPETPSSREEGCIDASIEKVRQDQARGIGSSDRASSLIEELETSLDKLQSEKENSLKSMEWLKFHREELSREAAEAALKEYYGDNSITFIQDNSEEIELLSSQIKKYLHLIYLCLEVGSWDVMDAAINEKLLPSNKGKQMYVNALKFIRDRKVKKDDFLKDCSEMMVVYFNYLIGALPERL